MGALILLLAIGGCGLQPVEPKSTAELSCEALLQAFDVAVAEAEVGWSGAGRIEGFPYLRVDRFLASYRQETLADAALASWIQKMRELDRTGRRLELMRLPGSSLDSLGADPESLQQRMEACARQMRIADMASKTRLAELRRVAVMADDYSLAQRTFGLYPLTFIPVSEGVYRLQTSIRDDFAKEPADLPRAGRLLRYLPARNPDSADLLLPLRRDALGVPAASETELQRLFDLHAPIWEIDTAGPFDKPGIPYWQAADRPAVASARPVSYRYYSWTRWHDQVLLQLNYLVWFDERPPRSRNDLLSGRLDGVLWRVTLRADGQPLLYDSVHPCGCYHMFFPGADLTLKASLRRAPEPPLIPAPAPAWEQGSRVVLRLQSGSHYLQAVFRDDGSSGATYAFRDYAELYEIPGPDGRPRGLFSADGLVAGSERRERWVLWPMGVVSPGAMRGRGRHATAFIGRRHFDDPRLIESVFDSTPVTEAPLATRPQTS